MNSRPLIGLKQELAELSRNLATIWQAQLSLAKRRPDLAAPLLTRTARSGQRFRAFCRRLAEYVQVDRRGRIRPSYLGSRALASAAVGAAMSLALGVTGAQAAEIHVNASVGDPGCDLIDAILSANTDTAVSGCTTGSGPDVIHLNGIDQLFSAAYIPDFYGPTATPVITSRVTIEAAAP